MRTTITVPNPTPVVEFDPFKPMVLPWTNNRKSSRGRKKVTVPHDTIVQAKTAVSLVVQQIVAPVVIDPPIKKIEPPSVLIPLHQLKRLIGFDVVAEIKKMYERDFIKSHLQNVASPWNLVQEIFQKLKIGDGTILCMFNVEWVAYLVRVLKKDVNTIFFVDDGLDMNDGTGKISSIKAQLVVDMLGVPKENIIHHSKIEGNTMKFDYIVGNPPYEFPNSVNDDEKLWHLFVEKMIKEMPKGGTLAFVVPVSMMTGPGPEKKFFPLFKKNGVVDVMHAKVHEKKMFDAGVDTCHWIVRKSKDRNNLDDLFIGRNVFGPINKSILNKVINPDAEYRFKISDGGYQILNGKRVLIEKTQYLTTEPSGPYQKMFIGNGEMVFVETNGTLLSADKWKVVVPRSKAPNKQTMFIIPPGVGCDNLHGFIQYDTEEQAKSALSVFVSDLIIYCANTYKMSHGKYGSGYKALFHQTDLIVNPGAGEWDNAKLYEFFGITEEEKLEISTRMKKNK